MIKGFTALAAATVASALQLQAHDVDGVSDFEL